MRFHHIGYAVASIEDYLEKVLRPLFRPVSVTSAIADPIQKVRVCFAQMEGGTVIELVEGLAADSPVASIVGSRRGGMYHVCYEVEDIDATISRFRAQRFMPLGRPVPAAAFDGRRIVFMISPQRDLIEFVESAANTVP